MAKKKKPKPSESIHFRPSQVLGESFEALGEEWAVSRGEAVKRLAVLALYRLDVSFYRHAEALTYNLVGNVGFETACQAIGTRITQREQERATQNEPPLHFVERLKVAREVLMQYGLDEESIRKAEEDSKRIRLYLYRTDE